MSDLRTAVKQALEALGKWSIGYHVDAVELNDLIATLEAALEQPEQEPLCKGIPRRGCNYLAACDTACNKCGKVHAHHQMIAQFHAAQQPEQEPVEPLKGWKLNHARKHPDEEGVAEIGYLDPEDDRFAPILTVDTGLYYQDSQALPLAVAILSMLSAHPPRREWRGLTEEEVEELQSGMQASHKDVRAIEAALKERNA